MSRHSQGDGLGEAIFRHIQIPILFGTVSGRIRYANPAARALLPSGLPKCLVKVNHPRVSIAAPIDFLLLGDPFHDGRLVSLQIAFGPEHGDRFLGYEFVVNFRGEQGRAWVLLQSSQQQRQMRQLFELANLGIWAWDISSGNLLWSEEVFRMFGVASDSAPLKTSDFFDRVVARDKARTAQSVEEALESGRYDIQFDIRDGNGKRRSLHTVGLVTFSANGEPTRLVGTCQDVTDYRGDLSLLRSLVGILDRTPDMVGVIDHKGRLVYANESMMSLFGHLSVQPADRVEAPDFGRSVSNPLGVEIAQYHPDWAFARLQYEALPKAVKGGVWSGETAVLDSENCEVPVLQHVAGHIDPVSGELQQISTVMRDLRPERERNRAIRRVNSLMDAVANSVTDAFWVRLGSNIVYANHAMLEMCGSFRGQFMEHPELLADLFAEDDQEFILGLLKDDRVFEELMERNCRTGADTSPRKVLCVRASPCEFDEARQVSVVTLVDITELEVARWQLEESNQKLLRLAMEDELTGLPNRRATIRVLSAEVSRAERHGAALSIASLDLDHFKRVNDDYGHEEGDRVLSQMSAVVRARLRASDHFGRWGGEEFLIIFPETGAGAAASICEELRQAVERRFRDEAPDVTVSFGVAELQYQDAMTELLKKADAALYRAKVSGRNRVCALDAVPCSKETAEKS
ncbi:MAG: sensor domain-containing diguanylate cyclase [Wenzhouxiangella sp.]|nr:MAG: sensor domain-containing diguanylate cyclase [Wenzhouxiangella sp.]